eukprot:SRR837773.22683.p1 GENE.SRR837773.22683~~SRR837773.22683.p1  ORF type:complete len:188 (-),score=23.17 SRR837773.22683:10-573(-)
MKQLSQDSAGDAGELCAAWAAQQGEAMLVASWQAQALWNAAAAAAGAFALASPLGLSMLSAESSPFQPMTSDPLDSYAVMADPAQGQELPSQGSALHFTGQCKPCAWFWKPRGCQNGQDCAHCHLCPEGELKERKKAKEAALRSGILEPRSVRADSDHSTAEVTTAGSGPPSGGSPRTVKLAHALTA